MNGCKGEGGNNLLTDLVDPIFRTLDGNNRAPVANETNSIHVTSTSEFDDVLKSGDKKRMKRLLRNGNWSCADEVRRTLWWKLCVVANGKAAHTSLYQEMVRELFGNGDRGNAIQSFLFKTLCLKQCLTLISCIILIIIQISNEHYNFIIN